MRPRDLEDGDCRTFLRSWKKFAKMLRTTALENGSSPAPFFAASSWVKSVEMNCFCFSTIRRRDAGSNGLQPVEPLIDVILLSNFVKLKSEAIALHGIQDPLIGASEIRFWACCYSPIENNPCRCQWTPQTVG